jgi:NADPH:quinone reductase
MVVKAVLCKAFGEPDSLVIEEVAPLKAGPGQVVISVKACGINFFDGLMVQGKYQTKPPFPFSPGAEVAGIIRDVGADVTDFRPGMRVLAFAGVGGYAEEVAVETWRVLPIPAAMDFKTAAGFIITYGTSYHGLKDRAQLKPGETLLVLGAAGGVGLTAVEIGKVMGARVIAAASSPEKLALCKERGADDLINYSSEDLRGRLKELTGGNGVDVVYDPVGGAFAEPAIRSMAWQGRYLVVGFAAGDIPKIPTNLLLLKSSALLGVFWGAAVQRDPAQNARNMAALMTWLDQGKLKPHISATYPLTRAVEALNTVMQRKVMGKVILTTETA